MKDLIIKCTLMCDEEHLKEEYKRIREQMGSGLIVIPWYDQVIINETDDEIKFDAIEQIKENEKPFCYDELCCEVKDCSECAFNEGDDEYDY